MARGEKLSLKDFKDKYFLAHDLNSDDKKEKVKFVVCECGHPGCTGYQVRNKE